MTGKTYFDMDFPDFGKVSEVFFIVIPFKKPEEPHLYLFLMPCDDLLIREELGGILKFQDEIIELRDKIILVLFHQSFD